MTPQLHFALWILLAVLVAAVVSFAATPLVKKLAVSVGAVDVPKDNRRMHKVPIPRLGGLAIFIAGVEFLYQRQHGNQVAECLHVFL